MTKTEAKLKLQAVCKELETAHHNRQRARENNDDARELALINYMRDLRNKQSELVDYLSCEDIKYI